MMGRALGSRIRGATLHPARAWRIAALPVLGLALLLAPAGPVQALSCLGWGSPERAFESADVVFQGRVIGEGDGATRYRVSRAWKGLRAREVWVDQTWKDVPRYPLFQEYLVFAYGDVHGSPSDVYYDPDRMLELSPGPLPRRLFLRDSGRPQPAEPFVYADHYSVEAGHLHLHSCQSSLNAGDLDHPKVAAFLASKPEMELRGRAPWPALIYPLQLVAKVLLLLEDAWPTEFRLALVTLAGVILVAWWKRRVRRQGLSHVPKGRP